MSLYGTGSLKIAASVLAKIKLDTVADKGTMVTTNHRPLYIFLCKWKLLGGRPFHT